VGEAQWEAETIINFNEDEAAASIYTASKRVASLLERRGLKPSTVDRARDGGPCGWRFDVPKVAVLLKPGKRAIKIGGAYRVNSIAPGVATIATRGDLSACPGTKLPGDGSDPPKKADMSKERRTKR
jgi:hypothetical protein